MGAEPTAQMSDPIVNSVPTREPPVSMTRRHFRLQFHASIRCQTPISPTEKAANADDVGRIHRISPFRAVICAGGPEPYCLVVAGAPDKLVRHDQRQNAVGVSAQRLRAHSVQQPPDLDGVVVASCAMAHMGQNTCIHSKDLVGITAPQVQADGDRAANPVLVSGKELQWFPEARQQVIISPSPHRQLPVHQERCLQETMQCWRYKKKRGAHLSWMSHS